MTPRQRVVIALGLLGTFVVSIAAGAVVGRLMHSTESPPVVAMSSPTPPAPAASTPTPVPSAEASPIGTVLATPTAPRSSSATPSQPASALPVPTPSAVVLDPPTAEDFAAALLAAFQTADKGYLDGRLHPAVIERYGATQCQHHISGFQPDQSAPWQVTSVAGPAPWTWTTDGIQTVIPDAWTVAVQEPGTGQRDLHFAPADGTWRWFLDCGSPQ